MLYGIKDASNLTVISNKTNKPILYADYCNKTDINFTAQTVYAMKKGVKAIGWDSQREGTMSTEMQVFDLKWIALLMGSDFTTGVTTISKRETLKVTSGTATLTDTPKSGSLLVFKVENGEQGTEQIVGTPASTANTYSIATKNLTFNTTTTFATDGQVIVYYLIDSASTAKSFTVSVDKFPSGYTIVGDTTIKDNTGVEQIVQFRMNNVKPKSQMQLSMSSDNVTTLSIEWDIFADVNNDMFTFKAL